MLPFDPLSHAALIAPLATLLLALGIDALVGEFKGLPHPVALLGRLISRLDERLNRPERSLSLRRGRGILMVAGLVLLAIGLGIGIEVLAAEFGLAWVGEVLLIASLLAQRSLFEHVRAVKVALETDGLEAAQREVGKIVGRDPKSLDAPGVARAGIESLAENFSDGVVAPLVWFVLFGLPGLLVYKTVNTLDSMVGYRTEKHRDFGWASARLDDVLNLLPARLAGLILAHAAGGRMALALRIMLRDAKLHKSPNAGWPEAAMAGALNLKLAGPRVYPGQTVDDPWIGDGAPEASVEHMGRALNLYLRACAINVLLIAGLALVR